jgi:putative radical SAM enzyme (TIGR03279 family)
MADRALEIVSMGDPADFDLASGILSVGDRIIEVAGRQATDQLDFHFHASSGGPVTMRVERKDGTVEDVTLPAKAIAGLGIYFEAMDFRRCRCKCPFCFVDQMPKGMRDSLYVKDEDFRLSFLYGNFTTMNDVTDDELNKIIEQKNSPQWVSVHVVEDEMRRFIFGRPMKRNILDTLRRLAEGGISIHTQAVIVPGKNDGDYLRETIETLESLHPNVKTLAVVPVGLTRHRDGLPGIRSYRDDEMGEVIDLADEYRRRFQDSRGSRFVFPSDEWYVGSNRDVPGFEDYEGFPQLDNGVGMIRDTLQEIEEDLETWDVPADLSHVRIVTGSLGSRVFERHVFPLLSERGVKAPPVLVSADNNFFGATVTCSGLLVGADIIAAVRESERGQMNRLTLVPPNCLNHDGVTIDEMTPGGIGDALGCTVVAPETTLVEAIHEHGVGR